MTKVAARRAKPALLSNHHRWLSEVEFMLSEAEVAKTTQASPDLFAVPSTSLRELDCIR